MFVTASSSYMRCHGVCIFLFLSFYFYFLPCWPSPPIFLSPLESSYNRDDQATLLQADCRKVFLPTLQSPFSTTSINKATKLALLPSYVMNVSPALFVLSAEFSACLIFLDCVSSSMTLQEPFCTLQPYLLTPQMGQRGNCL